MTIDHIHIRRLDLNLLLSLDALMESRSVSRAAERLGIGQSAMSHALRRLRDLFDDAILVREGAGLVPTDRALALWAPVHAALEDLEAGLEDARGFDPSKAERLFSVSIPDYVAEAMAPRLIRDARAVGSKLAFRIEGLGRDEALDALISGRLDAVVAVMDAQPFTIAETLFEDGFPTLFDPTVWDAPYFGGDVRRRRACARLAGPKPCRLGG